MVKSKKQQYLSRNQKLRHIKKAFSGRGLKLPRSNSNLYKQHITPLLHEDLQGGAFLGTLSKTLAYISAATGIIAPIASFIPPLAPISAGLGAISALSGVGSKVAIIADMATQEEPPNRFEQIHRPFVPRGHGLKPRRAAQLMRWAAPATPNPNLIPVPRETHADH